MAAFYIQMYAEYDNPEDRIYLASCAFNDQITKKLQTLCPDYKIKGQGCRPLFLILRSGQCVGVVDGLSAPSIAGNVKLFIPAVIVENAD